MEHIQNKRQDALGNEYLIPETLTPEFDKDCDKASMLDDLDMWLDVAIKYEFYKKKN